MPLVYGGPSAAEPITEAQKRARKVLPQYARGEPVKVGFARNQAEAELIQGLLLEEGIPSFVRRSRGFDVPDFLAAGPRDVLVPEAGAEAARDLLQGTELHGEGFELQDAIRQGAPVDSGEVSPQRLAAWIMAGLLAAGAIVWVLYQLTG